MYAPSDTATRSTGPDRSAAIIDVVVYLVAVVVFWGVEEWLRSIGRFPLPGLLDGAPSLVASFFVVVALMKRRGQRWSDFGLVRPRRWWLVPAWGLVVMVVHVASQMTIVPLLSSLLHVPPPDFSKYDPLRGNLKLFLFVTPGAMITGGFIEEFVYRGMMFDRLARIVGGTGRRTVLAAALLCGIPFGLAHFQWGVGGVLVTAVMGSMLGLMYLATRRNLWPLVFGHAALDFLLLLQVYLGVLKP
ncbi:MAG TPA: type II CAAX endopeptidase family protein [Candidatus Krumholzibacteria bacterium]|nr:type II CAAX endopeptidase family protein [Candidatus Krumholzibacteria bacterium]